MRDKISINNKTLIVLIVIVCILAFLTYSFISPHGFFSGLSNDLKGIEAEEGFTYTDLDGNPIQLAEYKGKPLIINAWATWTPFSKDELILFSKYKAEYGDAVTVLAINRMENVATIKAYLDFIGKPGGIVFLGDPTDNFYKSIQGYAMPETVFYDSEGIIVNHARGVLTEEDIKAGFEALIVRE